MEQSWRVGQDNAHVSPGAEVRHQAPGQDDLAHRHVSPVRLVACATRRRRDHALGLCESAVHAQERAHANR